ncbi:MAG: hypothetical protein EXQ61_06215 [Ilumatobacteraceae bacterium]|nr:hypothetical protein [Ilumatobacteraceae bacterium]
MSDNAHIMISDIAYPYRQGSNITEKPQGVSLRMVRQQQRPRLKPSIRHPHFQTLYRVMVDGYSIEPGANLAGADLSHADLTGADLTDANLSGTILKGTTMPDGAFNN